MKLRPLGHILLDLEDVLTEMIELHELQKGDVLSLVNSYIDVHHPDCIEEYEDDTHPEFKYGPKE